jgi:hypothetical protein
VSAKQLKVAWDIIHRAGGSEVIRYENGDPISMGCFLAATMPGEPLGLIVRGSSLTGEPHP